MLFMHVLLVAHIHVDVTSIEVIILNQQVNEMTCGGCECLQYIETVTFSSSVKEIFNCIL